jgi:L-fucose isomerase-like protein
MSFQAVYVPIGVGTYHMETANAAFQASKELLSGILPEVVCPEGILLSVDDLAAYLDGKNPDLVILQNVTFANAAYATEVLRRYAGPIVLWTLREPVEEGGRLRLNSLTGAYSAANAIRAFRGEKPFEYIFGSPEEKAVRAKMAGAVKAAQMKKELASLKIAAIGHTPQGFGFGRALDSEMARTFGTELISIEARELINKAKSFTDEECAACLADAEKAVVGMDRMPEKNVRDFARLYKAYKDYVTEKGIGAIASRCWPDFFVDFGTPVCTVLSLLNSMGVCASCEADTYGALSMYIASRLTGSACFFGDPVAMNEEENTITYWHCGMAACSLARKDTGAEVGVHPNRKIGPTMEFGCRPAEKATIFRIGRTYDGRFRLFIASGSIPDKPKQFLGTSIVVETNVKVKEMVTSTIEGGWEPHYVVAYGDIADTLEMIGHMLDLPVVRY